MYSFKWLSEEIGVTRASISRIVKREGVESTLKYDPETRKQTKYVCKQDAEILLTKYKK